MSCPGGCVNGGGQPKTHDPQALPRRASSIYAIDEASVLRKSHDNPLIKQVYQVRTWGWSWGCGRGWDWFCCMLAGRW